MRKIPFLCSLLAVAIHIAPAEAQQTDNSTLPQQFLLPSQSSVYNQHGLSLPSAPTVHGSDIVRGAGGVSCQSSVSNGGAYFDAGLINSEDMFDRGATAAYGRVVIPLGKKAERLDCNKLYELEIRRLEMELEIMRMSGAAMASSADLLQLRQQREAPPPPPQPAPAVQPTAPVIKATVPEKKTPDAAFRVINDEPIIVETFPETNVIAEPGDDPEEQVEACNCSDPAFSEFRGLR